MLLVILPTFGCEIINLEIAAISYVPPGVHWYRDIIRYQTYFFYFLPSVLSVNQYGGGSKYFKCKKLQPPTPFPVHPAIFWQNPPVLQSCRYLFSRILVVFYPLTLNHDRNKNYHCVCFLHRSAFRIRLLFFPQNLTSLFISEQIPRRRFRISAGWQSCDGLSGKRSPFYSRTTMCLLASAILWSIC